MGFQGRGESDGASIPRRDVRVKDEQRVGAAQSGFYIKPSKVVPQVSRLALD